MEKFVDHALFKNISVTLPAICGMYSRCLSAKKIIKFMERFAIQAFGVHSFGCHTRDKTFTSVLDKGDSVGSGDCHQLTKKN